MHHPTHPGRGAWQAPWQGPRMGQALDAGVPARLSGSGGEVPPLGALVSKPFPRVAELGENQR